ncbi:hypothetical protein RN001_016182 [Aquatica leii]|uniref:DDHD domain-containing protein n=1 Tax=Aquatica leii TaxID=1421715 RepID=A0AAN7QB61_9COLE|nr:hypothetical protein RN001_016182 [Aquatica leii]
MDDKNNSKRTVNNQLFNASVTGATYDDFSQNAMLFPVSDLNNSQANIENATQKNEQQFAFSEVNTSTILSPSPMPTGYSNDTQSKGHTSNLYRRITNKKPTYAQIPGLVSSQPLRDISSYAPVSTPPLVNYFQPIQNQNILPECILPSSSSILQPENAITLEPNKIGSNTFIPPLSTTKNSQTSALLTPSNSASLITESGIAPSYDGTSSLSNQMVQFSYGNEIPSSTSSMGTVSQMYRPVYHHWFHKRICEGRTLWDPFSMLDSLALEKAFTSADLLPDTVVATNGGRYDVNILRRERYPVYWNDPPTEVRRCSWFSKGNSEGRFVPYEENIATMLEEEYKTAFESSKWHGIINLPNGDLVTFHGPEALVLLPPTPPMDPWGNTPQMQPRVRLIKRGMDEFDIDEGEPNKVDHLVFVVHGIGSVCDLKFRSVQEVVDEFRTIALQLVQSHYRSSCETQTTNRIEILPISWHGSLHSDGTGIDQKLKNITLESIPRLRDFTNSTLLDILFYSSPTYCQTITSAVISDLNRIYSLFQGRNPTFEGGVSLVGHSLGSLILFDILSHMIGDGADNGKDINIKLSESQDPIKETKKTLNEAGAGETKVTYSQLHFKPTALFALGSPIGMFITVRGLDKLGVDFALPTCTSFFNMFHPYDPVAYRMESLINPDLANLKPVLIPHHKGRKRMHLELKETMYRVSSDLKQKVVDSMKYTWNTIFQMAMFGRQGGAQSNLEAEVDRVLEEQMAKGNETSDEGGVAVEEEKTDMDLGILNGGRRIDYVLQEAPFEIFNEYLFAVTSHLCYWESEDTVLFILKEIYRSMGINADGSQSTTN